MICWYVVLIAAIVRGEEAMDCLSQRTEHLQCIHTFIHTHPYAHIHTHTFNDLCSHSFVHIDMVIQLAVHTSIKSYTYTICHTYAYNNRNVHV